LYPVGGGAVSLWLAQVSEGIIFRKLRHLKVGGLSP
jgi:hypothetical protein